MGKQTAGDVDRLLDRCIHKQTDGQTDNSNRWSDRQKDECMLSLHDVGPQQTQLADQQTIYSMFEGSSPGHPVGIFEALLDRQTEGMVDRQTETSEQIDQVTEGNDKQTDRYMDRPSDICIKTQTAEEIDRWTDRQTERRLMERLTE